MVRRRPTTSIDIPVEYAEYFQKKFKTTVNSKACKQALELLMEIDPDYIRAYKADRDMALQLPEIMKLRLCEATGENHWVAAAMTILCDYLHLHQFKKEEQANAKD